MKQIRNNLFKIVLKILCVNYVLCDVEFDPKFFDFDRIKREIFTKSDLSISNLINESISYNWTENHNCLSELITIKDGLMNFEEWAIKVVDSWGKGPSGLMEGNFFDFGSFSQCFHIKRNGTMYKTQYCIGQLMFKAEETIQTSFTLPRIDIGPSISIGICLPKNCSVNHLESIVNRVIQARSIKNVSVKIPKNTCQFEEGATNLKTIDLAAIGLIGILFVVIVLSTSYDVYCIKNNQTKNQWLSAFSIYTNGKKLFSIQRTTSSNAIHCIHGIRVLSTLWIIIGHTNFMYASLPITNRATGLEYQQKYYPMIFYASMISVDSFFAISGLLAAMNMLKDLKQNRKLNILSMYIHRYLRLTPTLGACVLISMSLWPLMGNGPVWKIMVEFINPSCDRYWWSTLTYVQNYVNPTQICFKHSWYLAVDMQLFFIAPFIMYLLYRFDSKMIMILISLTAGCVGCTLAVHLKNNVRTLLEDDKLTKAYYPTHIRFSPWLIGVLTGYLLIKYPKSSIRIPNKINLLGWIISLIMMSSVLFAYYPLLNFECSPFVHGLYDALSRVGWSTGLSYIIFSCVHGSGGIFNTFLSHPFWQLPSRLNYAIYLVHFPIIMMSMATIRTPLYFTEVGAIMAAIENYILSFIVAIIITLAIESPVISFEKIFFNIESKGETKELSNQNQIKQRHKNGTNGQIGEKNE